MLRFSLQQELEDDILPSHLHVPLADDEASSEGRDVTVASTTRKAWIEGTLVAVTDKTVREPFREDGATLVDVWAKNWPPLHANIRQVRVMLHLSDKPVLTYPADKVWRKAAFMPGIASISQQVPKSFALRDAFEAQRGYTLLSADYLQVETRMVAHFSQVCLVRIPVVSSVDCHYSNFGVFAKEVTSQDPQLLGLLQRRDSDIMSCVASHLYSTSLDRVTKEQREKAKTLFYGLLYGAGVHSLSAAADVPPGEIKVLTQRLKQKFSRAFQVCIPFIELKFECFS